MAPTGEKDLEALVQFERRAFESRPPCRTGGCAMSRIASIARRKLPDGYGVENFINQCKESVFTYTAMWREMTEAIAFWVDMDDPYVTYHNNYIESEWWALKIAAPAPSPMY